MFNFGNLGEMMKQLKSMQENMEKAKEELRNEKIVVEVGGGMVKLTTNGLGEVIDLEIDKSMLSPDNYDVLKELIISAINESNARAKEVLTEKMAQATGLPTNLPGIGNLF
ncbi:MAG: YbaB/EbfC family nucleoid-associated protein [Aquificota bacterium]|nr:MAG: YbaB/EbfC family nucleoid-associated protein [Aquificota bacterium]